MPVASIAAMRPRSPPTLTSSPTLNDALDVAPRADLARHLAAADPERERERQRHRAEQDRGEQQQHLRRDAELRERGDGEDAEHDGLGEHADRAGDVHLLREAVDLAARDLAEHDARDQQRERDEQPRQEQDHAVERVGEELEAEQRQRGEDDDEDDRDPHRARDQRGQRAAQADALEHVVHAPALAELVDAGRAQQP